jgi:ABC-2 type transport system permease protein
MKKILAITIRDIRLRFSSPVEWLFFLILPIVFTLVLAGGTGGSGDSRVRLVVVDQAGTSLSAELVAALERSESVRPELLTLEEADYQFDSRRASAVLVIPQGFDRAALEDGGLTLELRQLPNNLNALVAQRAVQAVIGRVGRAVEIARGAVAEAESIRPFETDAARQAYFDEALTNAQTLLDEAPDRITEAQSATPDQVEYDPRANSSAGQLITWVFIPLIGISSMFASERQTGTLRRLLTTPTRKGTYLLGTIFGQVVTAMVQMLLLICFGIFVMNLNWGSQPLALFVMMTASALAAAALGTTFGTFVKTEGQASGLGIMTGMVTALLGGCWYPLELFPKSIQTIVQILPTTWAMRGMLDIVLRGQGLAAILPIAGVLLGFAALFFSIGVWRFRYE